MCDAWDDWTGQLSLDGVDPTGWTLNRLLAAFEAQIRRSAKDEDAARRTLAEFAAEPRELRRQRLAEARQGRTSVVTAGRMSEDDAEALVARLAAADAAFG